MKAMKKLKAIKPRKGQTQLRIWKARVKDLRAQNDASKSFPVGYRSSARYIRKKYTIYRFKFVQPGKTIGRSFDGLVKIKGKWKIFPKPWRYLKKKK